MEENRNPMENQAPAPIGADPKEDTSTCPSQYDAAVIETWLEDKAREGWQLKEFTSLWGSGVFEKSEPRPTRYRLTPLARKEKAPDEERLDLCAAQGWEYVATIPYRFHVWRTDNPYVAEMDTDPVTQAEGYRWVRKQMGRDLFRFLIFLLVLLGGFLYGNLSTGGDALLYMAENDAPGQNLLCAGACVTIPALSVLQLRGMNRTLRRLRAGVPMDRPAPYRRRQRISRALLIFGTLAYIYLVFISYFLDDYRDIDDDPAAMERVRYVDIAALDPAITGAEVWRCDTKALELIPRTYRTIQVDSSHYGEVTDAAYTEYYRLLTVGLAKEMERELVARHGTRSTHLPRESFGVSMEEVTSADLDGFHLKDWHDEGQQNAVVRLGKSVLYVEYRGPADLREHTDYLAELLG